MHTNKPWILIKSKEKLLRISIDSMKHKVLKKENNLNARVARISVHFLPYSTKQREHITMKRSFSV